MVFGRSEILYNLTVIDLLNVEYVSENIFLKKDYNLFYSIKIPKQRNDFAASMTHLIDNISKRFRVELNMNKANNQFLKLQRV